MERVLTLSPRKRTIVMRMGSEVAVLEKAGARVVMIYVIDETGTVVWLLWSDQRNEPSL
jgi:hypothetical protein